MIEAICVPGFMVSHGLLHGTLVPTVRKNFAHWDEY